jgi:hypothetical protein
MRTTLRAIDKTFNTTLRTSPGHEGQPLRRECWSAVTRDGQWGFERIEDSGTPWVVTFHPGLPDEAVINGYFGTLRSARVAVETAAIKLPSVSRAEHAAGLNGHPQNIYQACPACLEGRNAELDARYAAQRAARQ